MNTLTLLNHEVMPRVEEHIYTFEDANGKLLYKEWIDESGKVIDSMLSDTDGFTIDDFDLLMQVQEAVDKLTSNN